MLCIVYMFVQGSEQLAQYLCSETLDFTVGPIHTLFLLQLMYTNICSFTTMITLASLFTEYMYTNIGIPSPTCIKCRATEFCDPQSPTQQRLNITLIKINPIVTMLIWPVLHVSWKQVFQKIQHLVYILAIQALEWQKFMQPALNSCKWNSRIKS